MNNYAMLKVWIKTAITITLTTFAVSVAALGQAPTSSKLESTYWAGTDSAGGEFVIGFHGAGKFSYVPSIGDARSGVWNFDQNGIELRLDGDAGIFKGKVEGNAFSGEATSSDGSSRNWSAIELPAVVSSEAPHFPPVAKAAHATGTTIVEIQIEPNGSVSSAKKISGHPLFKIESEAIAKLWKFSALATNEVRTIHLFFTFMNALPDSDTRTVRTFQFRSPYQVEIYAEPSAVNFSSPICVEPITRN